jgi:hypothetical protein
MKALSGTAHSRLISRGEGDRARTPTEGVPDGQTDEGIHGCAGGLRARRRRGDHRPRAARRSLATGVGEASGGERARHGARLGRQFELQLVEQLELELVQQLELELELQLVEQLELQLVEQLELEHVEQLELELVQQLLEQLELELL